VFDVVAGVTIGVVAVPQSLSYAMLAGLPAVYGLYSDLQICYPIFGTSKYLVVGPVAIMSIMSRQAMEKIGPGIVEGSKEWVDGVCFLSVLVAFWQLVAGGLEFGPKLAALFPEAAITGFSSAAALMIGSTQLPSLLGLNSCRKDDGNSCSFLGTVWFTMSNLEKLKMWTCGCALSSAFVLWSFKAMDTKSITSKLGALCVVIVGCLFVFVTFDNERGEPIGDLRIVGHIPAGLPEMRWIPVVPRGELVLLKLVFSSLPIAFVGFAEASAIAKASTKCRGGDLKEISDNSEILALAACNSFTAIVGGYPVTGSFSRTAINAESGARSPLSTAVAAAMVVVVLLVATPMLKFLPRACVSTIVLSAVVRLIDVGEFQRHLKKPQLDSIVFFSVFFASIVLGAEVGLLAGILVNLLTKRAAVRRRGTV